jgi:hypothetical protein
MDRETKRINIIATLPPYAEHRRFIIEHPLVDELRFNSIWDLNVTCEELLRRLREECGDKRLWIDLKARQLRIIENAWIPEAFAHINHKIQVDLPTDAHFRNYTARVVEIVAGDRLIFDPAPRTAVGRGQPLNIIHPSLKIDGFLLESDRQYVVAAARLGMHNFLLSFYEGWEDSVEVLTLDPKANIVAKIESRRGMKFVRNEYNKLPKSKRPRLMAARDDLWEHYREQRAGYLPAVQDIVRADSKAIAASRILTSLENSGRPSSNDLSDLELLLRMGYRTIMLSDGLCLDRVAFMKTMSELECLFVKGT